MLTTILVALALVVIAFISVVSLRPSEFRVTRSGTVAAPPGTVFAHVNDLHAWEAWSPWAKLDPAAKNTYEGPVAGAGAAFAWSGNNKIGQGRMTITDSRPSEFIRFRLDFVKPFKGTNTAEFTFKPNGNQTVVTWSMFGKNNFVSKAIGLFLSFDDMIGRQFEQGLTDMKSVAESAVAKERSTIARS